MEVGDRVEMQLDELHHRVHDIRDHLFKGGTLVLSSEGEHLAVIKPMGADDAVPDQALVRSFSYIRLHKKTLLIRLRQGSKIVLTYHGRKMGVIDPEPV